MLNQNLHKNHSFSTFVLLPMTEQNTMIIDTEVEVPHETTLTTKIIPKTDTVLHLEIETDFVMTKVLLRHTTPDQDMIHTNVILDDEAYAQLKSPQKSFVQYFRSPSNDRTKHYDNRYRSRSTSRDNSYNKNYSQNRYRSTSRDRDRFRYDKSTTPPHYSRSRYDTYKRDSRSYRSPYRSSFRSPYRQNSRPRYRSRSYSRDNKFTKYTNSYRPPSRPRDFRFSRSRSHSKSRNKINMIQQQDQTDPIKFEVHMYHPTAKANAVTPTSWFYTLYVHTPSSIVQRDNPSRLEIDFLLDSGASISVLNYPTYITLTKLLDIRSNHTSDVGPTRNSKTLTVANQTEVPILHYANIKLNTTIDEDSRYFSVPSAVADIKYNILGTPFFEDNIQNINIQDFTLEFKYQSKTHPNYAKFTTLLSKDYPYLTFIELTQKLKYA